jgi:hypothetical protein
MREVERGSVVNCDLTIKSIITKFGRHDSGHIAIVVMKFKRKILKPGGARSNSPFFDSAETPLNGNKKLFPSVNFDGKHIIRTSVVRSITLTKNQYQSSHSGGGR